jgi:hypothetical protein
MSSKGLPKPFAAACGQMKRGHVRICAKRQQLGSSCRKIDNRAQVEG